MSAGGGGRMDDETLAEDAALVLDWLGSVESDENRWDDITDRSKTEIEADNAAIRVARALPSLLRELGDTRARLAEQTERADHNAAAVNANADMIVDLRARLVAALGATDQAGDGG